MEKKKQINLLKEDDKIRLEVYDKYIGNCYGLPEWYNWHPNETFLDEQYYNYANYMDGDFWFNNIKRVIIKRINERRAETNK